MGEYVALKSLVENMCEQTGTKKKYWAAKCGFGEKEFSRLLNGRKLITSGDIKKLCIGLDVKPNEILGFN